ncbi:MAG: radical SAM protein [Candidatus Omnitrophica bacterium]|nr:radical SAM protein [Candidatus Omnitrophota bacterium]
MIPPAEPMQRREIATKGFRKDTLPGRACITWLINNKCNYRCSYCLNGFEEPTNFKILPSEEWIRIWEDIYQRYGTVAMQVTGGEPTLYPRFFEILKGISLMHNIELQTNLFWDPRLLIDQVSAEGISRVGGSFHPEFTPFEVFLKKIVAIRDAGFRVEINYVASPAILERAEEYIAGAKDKDIQFSIISFVGEYQGKKYPESYTQEEKDILKKLNVTSGESAESMANWDLEHKKVGPIKEVEVPARVCRMGQMYTWLKPDGEAMRCCKSPLVLGNMIEGTFAFLDEALPCKLDNCICWRNMTLGEEDRWQDRWPGVK